MSLLPKHKQSSKVTTLVIKALHNWIINHDHVKESSCSRNFIRIKIDGGGEKVNVIKLYLQVPIKDIINKLYYGMIKPPSLGGLDEAIDNDGNIIISDSKLRKFFPPQVQLMSKKRINLCVLVYI